MPTLIGLIRLPFPKVIQKTAYTTDIASRIAFDSEGRAWALIERMEKLGTPPGVFAASLARLTLVRWQLVAPIPFETNDAITMFDQEPGSPLEAMPGTGGARGDGD